MRCSIQVLQASQKITILIYFRLNNQPSSKTLVVLVQEQAFNNKILFTHPWISKIMFFNQFNQKKVLLKMRIQALMRMTCKIIAVFINLKWTKMCQSTLSHYIKTHKNRHREAFSKSMSIKFSPRILLLFKVSLKNNHNQFKPNKMLKNSQDTKTKASLCKSRTLVSVSHNKSQPSQKLLTHSLKTMTDFWLKSFKKKSKSNLRRDKENKHTMPLSGSSKIKKWKIWERKSWFESCSKNQTGI